MSATKILSAASSLLLTLVSLGCGAKTTESAVPAPSPPAAAEALPAQTYDYTHKVIAGAEQRGGQYWTVAIRRFVDTREVEAVPFGRKEDKAETTKSDGGVNVTVEIAGRRQQPDTPIGPPPQLNKRAREILKNALVKSDAFTVVERERILEIIREINFGKTSFTDPATSPEEGKLY